MRLIIVKNTKGTDDTWCGQFIADGGSYTLQNDFERESWAINKKVNQDIWSGVLKVGDGNSFLNESAGDKWLKLTNTVKISEERIETGGHYQAQGFAINAPATAGWFNFDVSYPHPISLLAAEWNNKTEFDGDEIEFLVGPDTITGTITANIAIGDTELNVSQTVIDNTAVGYHLKINAEDFGRVLSIDAVNLKVTVENAATGAHVDGDYVKQTVKILPASPLAFSGRDVLGESKIGGSFVPANVILRARYKNNSSPLVAKKMVFILEYLY